MPNELRPSGTGYVGDLPEGWSIVPMGDACSKVTDGTHATPDTTDEGRPYVTAIHVKKGKIDFDSCLFLSEEDHREIYKRCNPVRGDLAVVNIGAGVGECGYVDVDFEFSMKNVALLKPNAKHVAPLYLLNSHQFRKDRIAYVVKSGGAQPFLSLRDLRKLPVLLPPLPEQRKIADILSTWDRAIETTEALLATARTQKRALMQSLLTGKRRFPEFEGQEWKEVRLGDVLEINYGKSPRDIFDDSGKYPVLGTGGVTGRTNAVMADGPVIVIGRKGTIDSPQWVDGKFWCIDTTYFCTTNDGNDLGWLFAWLGSINLKIYNEASGVPSLSRETLRSIKVTLPSKAEQQRIAEVFVGADHDIESLNSQIDKLRTEKKALMQQLLTGKRRVAV